MGALTLLGGEHQQQPPQIVPSSAAPAHHEPAPTAATHTRAIGIIHPPPDIRVIIEKTATLVAEKGAQFERRVVRHHPGNAKFSFLQPSDPYHAYYQHRVSEIADRPAKPPSSFLLNIK